MHETTTTAAVASRNARSGGLGAWTLPVCGAALLALLALGSWGAQLLRAELALHRAEGQIARGYSALAARTLDQFQPQLTWRKRGCEALVSAHLAAGHTEPLELAAETCVDAGIESPTIYVGLAAAYEFAGKDQKALDLLNQVTKRYPGSPDAYYRMAQLFQRNKNQVAAAEAVFKAAERSENHGIALEALQIMASQGRWPEARRAAEMLRNVQTEEPEVKLLMARALLRGGDADAAKAVTEQARQLLAKRPELKQKLESAYPEVLKPST